MLIGRFKAPLISHVTLSRVSGIEAFRGVSADKASVLNGRFKAPLMSDVTVP